MAAADAAGVGPPTAGESTPLLPPGGEGGGAGGGPSLPPLKPKREPSGPFYGALRRTRRVAKALTNPWPRIYTLVLCAGVGGLLFGYDSSDIAIALPFIERSFPSVDSSNTLKEAVVSVTTLGAAIGAFCGGFFSDYYGRRSAILTSDLIFAMAALKMGVAMTPRQLIEGRWGVAIGLASIVGPVYIAECAPNSMRAMMVVMYALEIGVGTSLAYVLDFGFTHTTLSWRLMLSVAAVPAVLQMIAMFHLPESPRWLAHYGRLDEAKETMAALTLDPEDKELDAEELDNVFQRGQYLKSEEGQAESWNGARSREVVTQLILGVGLFLMNNFSGECALVYYSIEIIGMAGFASEDAIAQAIVNIGACATAGVLIGFFLIDRIGRRKLITISGCGTSISLFLLAASFMLASSRSPGVMRSPAPAVLPQLCATTGIDTCAECLDMACSFCGMPYEGPGQPAPGLCLSREGLPDAARDACTLLTPPSNSTVTYTLYKQGCPSGYGWVSMLALCSFQFWFQLGLGIVPAAVNAEYYPNSVRGLCNGSAVAISWLGNFCVSSTFLSLTAALGSPRLFCINATFVALGTLLVQFFLPETVGLSFVEIQAMFKMYGKPNAPPPWQLWEHMMGLRESAEGQSMSPSPRGGLPGEAGAFSSI